MKKIVLCLGIGFVSLFANAQNGLEKIIVEKYYISNAADSLASVGKLPVGSVTYRLFVDLKQGYTFQSAYGVAEHELQLATSTTFFNNEDFGSTTPNSISVVQAKSNTTMLDSWLSVGAACKGYFGIPKKLDDGIGTFVNADGILANNDTAAGIPLTIQDGLLLKTATQTLGSVTALGIDESLPIFDASNATENGQTLSTISGGWASLSGSVGADTNNIVLIAQVTTNGTFTYKLNIQIGTPVGESENYVWDSPISGELTIPSLSGSFTPIVTPKIAIDNSISASAHNEGTVVPLKATIASAGTISKVEFFVDNISVGVDNTEPYTVDYTAVKGTHTLTVKVTNENGVTTSNPVTFTIDAVVSEINLVDADSFGKVYPNPVSDIINIDFTSKQNNVTVQLFDIIGNIVIEKHFDSISQNQIERLNSSSLNSGIYYMLVSANGKQTSFKVVKK